MDLAAAVRDAVRSAAGDPVRAAAQQRYMRSALPFRGLAVPTVRTLVRGVVRGRPAPGYAEWSAAVEALWDGAEFREERYAALGVARSAPEHARAEASLPLYRHLVLTGAWWDLVDETAAHLVGAVLRAHHETAEDLRAWAREEDRWLRRAAILSQLRSKEYTDRRLLVDVIEPNLADPDVFVRKAIGWALRQYAHLDDAAAAWVRDLVAGYGQRLSPPSRREALR
ncbi:DNA alkylation repair protein [Georgenia sp. 311]|uniref:DNA alkylation repair protein n=1 Tax=Georgenia sp. 311 TaxID=2585134 RepID=UPI001112C05E|nr:DNA alkylation repair protein [Georgenia sp. 311]TNC18527.1 DNA alkylation repair protein [Georgenia sp. 311]